MKVFLLSLALLATAGVVHALPGYISWDVACVEMKTAVQVAPPFDGIPKNSIASISFMEFSSRAEVSLARTGGMEFTVNALSPDTSWVPCEPSMWTVYKFKPGKRIIYIRSTIFVNERK